ncbi:MAG: flagellar basal body L-ring protein FlgH [Proteobacteria bacterium]|nr:flagellar basal body L-ring protein FlgH [Pseudomonadota bacterium]MDE3208618.1 flagellar basal body L-ring protein FlgH [Pseudomonadota bacterium]
MCMKKIAYFLFLCLGGCGVLPQTSIMKQPLTAVASPPPSPDTSGAIYQAGDKMFFDDRRAHNVGDTLLIQINENMAASKNSNSSASRVGKSSFSVPLVNGLPGKTFQGAGLSTSSDSEFTGKGASASNNSIVGTIAVTVTQVLPNGNLKVGGSKELHMNQGIENIRFSGVVNPDNITANDTVESYQVADARIEYIGTGYINQAQTMGWLQRFFLSVLPY